MIPYKYNIKIRIYMVTRNQANILLLLSLVHIFQKPETEIGNQRGKESDICMVGPGFVSLKCLKVTISPPSTTANEHLPCKDSSDIKCHNSSAALPCILYTVHCTVYTKGLLTSVHYTDKKYIFEKYKFQ